MKKETLAIVGASGKSGRRVSSRLSNSRFIVRPLSRNTKHSFDWEDRTSWQSALQGVDRIYVTYFPDLAVPHAIADIESFIAVAKHAGIKHIILLSGRGEEGAFNAEKVVIESGITWNIVRSSWFMQNFSESFMLQGLKLGHLMLPETNALEPFVDADDIADVVVALFEHSSFYNQIIEVTGPELLSFESCVEMIATASDRAIKFSSVDIENYVAEARSQGTDENIIWLINELFINVLDGRNESTTSTIEAILGRPAGTFQQYVNSVNQTDVWREFAPQLISSNKGDDR